MEKKQTAIVGLALAVIIVAAIGGYLYALSTARPSTVIKYVNVTTSTVPATNFFMGNATFNASLEKTVNVSTLTINNYTFKSSQCANVNTFLSYNNTNTSKTQFLGSWIVQNGTVLLDMIHIPVKSGAIIYYLACRIPSSTTTTSPNTTINNGANVT